MWIDDIKQWTKLNRYKAEDCKMCRIDTGSSAAATATATATTTTTLLLVN